MKNRGMIAAIVVFALIIVGMFAFAFLKKSEINAVVPTPVEETVMPSPYANITRVDAKHFFIDGEHTLVGEIAMPTPCDLLNWDSTVAESMPEQVAIKFDVINNAEMCEQTVTAQRFKVTFRASEQAQMKAYFQDRSIELNLIPAQAGETPDDFELFIKG